MLDKHMREPISIANTPLDWKKILLVLFLCGGEHVQSVLVDCLWMLLRCLPMLLLVIRS